MAETLTQQPMTHMSQSLESSCVPTSISMVFSGFGVDISEQTLVERYFPNAALQRGEADRGVYNSDIVSGMVQIVEDMGLNKRLQVDMFMPLLSKFTDSPEEKLVVTAKPQNLRDFAKSIKGREKIEELVQVCGKLMSEGKVGVYAGNNRLLKQYNERCVWLGQTEIPDAFYKELSDFVAKGHIVGSQGGGWFPHAVALDGFEKEDLGWDEEGYVLKDPGGDSYPVSVRSVMSMRDDGVREGLFDYMFRLSPRVK